MRISLLFLALALVALGCRDKRAQQEKLHARYTDLGAIYLTGDVRAAEQALERMESLLTNKTFFAKNSLPVEMALLRARRAQIAQRLGEHARAEQLLREALAWIQLGGKSTNSGGTGLLHFIEYLDAKRNIKWKQTTN